MDKIWAPMDKIWVLSIVLGFLAFISVVGAITYGAVHGGDNDRDVLKTCIQSGRTATECRAILNGSK
jgi:hypothetical protein